MIKLLVLFFLSILTCSSFAQLINNDPLKLKEATPMLPEASSIFKYSDIPVSLYSGVPEITVPIYTVKLGQLSLPITLDYHSSGIMVNQEATWVGLGWDIFSGGAITYVPVGGNDQINSPSVSWAERNKLLSSTGMTVPITTHEDHYVGWGSVTETPADYKMNFNNVNLGLADKSELDVYSVNIPGFTFKFIMHPGTGTPVFVGNKNKSVISYDSSGRNFTITTDDGTKYSFLDKEWNMTGDAIERWLLSSIVDAQGNRIDLKYRNYGTLILLPSLLEKDYFNSSPRGTNRYIGQNECTKNPYYLESIETNKEIINFVIDDVRRIDIGGTGAVRLSKVTVKNKVDNSLVKDLRFSYDYFTGSTVGGDYTNDDTFYTGFNISTDRLSKRLKLTQFVSNDINGIGTEKFIFTYNESVSLPYKTSFARDFWGYYNGQSNNSSIMPNNAQHTLLPNLNQLDLDGFPAVRFANGTVGKYPSGNLDSGGANRLANENSVAAWTLSSITYPTGGKTAFELESNDFNNYKYYSANNVSTVNLNIWDFNNAASSLTQNFTITENKTVEVKARIQVSNGASFSVMKGAVIQLIGPLGPSAAARNFQLTDADQSEFTLTGYKTFQQVFNLVPGSYIFTCSGPDVIGSTYTAIAAGSLTYNSLTNSNKYIGAGLRIKKITNSDSNGTAISIRNYKYISETGLSSGILFTPAKCFDRKYYKYANTSNSYYDYACFLTSENFISSASATMNGNLGYSRVEVEDISTSDNLTNNGKEIFYYKNSKPTIFNHIPIFDYNTNGDLQKKVSINRTSDTLRVENYIYNIDDVNAEQLNYKVDDNWVGPSNEVDQAGFNKWAYIGRFNIYIYPNRNFHNYIQAREIIDYSGSSKIKKVTSYEYNSTNYAVKKISDVTSDNLTQSVLYRYPSDINVGVYSSMVGLNMLNYPIEVVSVKNNNVIGSNLTTYKANGSGYVPDKVYKLEFGTPFSYSGFTNFSGVDANKDNRYSTTAEISYDLYNSTKGNLLQMTARDGITTAYLWDSSGNYLMAQVKGAPYSQIIAQDGKACSYSSNALWTDLNSLAPGAMINTYGYYPLVGLKYTTNPGGTITYYDYDALGRLRLVRNADYHLVNRYKYNYKQ